MKSIEEFKKEQQAAMEKAIKAHEVMLKRAEDFAALGLPIPEYIADGKTHGAVHITYRNNKSYKSEELRSMTEAVALFAMFVNANTVIAHHVLKDGSFTSLHPEKYMPTKKASQQQYKRDAYKNSGYAVRLDVNHAAERGHTSAEIEFFAMVGNTLYAVSIEFGQGYIGVCPRLAPRRNEVRRFNRVESVSFVPNEDVSALADGYVSYSYGGDMGSIKTGADHRFLFVADTDEDDNGPVECTHAIAQLENLAAIVDGK